MRGERIPACQPLDPLAAQRRRADLGEQSDRIVERAARLVPFQQAELDVVLPSPLPGPKRLGELVDRPRIPGEQPLHQSLGARLQEPWPVVTVEEDRDRVDVGFRQDLSREHRRIDLDEPPSLEDVAQAAADPGAEFEDRSDAHCGSPSHARAAAFAFASRAGVSR